MNQTIIELLTKINDCGYEAYLVGGAVRDAILNQPNNDYDICTNMPLHLIKELYPKFHLMKPNNNRNTGVIRLNGLEIEISEFKGNTIAEDLHNRDFTINAMALDKNGNLIDPYNGIESLQQKTISLIDKKGTALQEDPLRILRGIRIAAKMNFEIDQNCKTQMEYKKRLLVEVAVERIYRELIQILISDNPSHYIRDNISIFFEVLPELKSMHQFNQNNPWHIYDVLEHTLVALEHTEKNIFLRFAVLFHDIGKPSKYTIDKEGTGHFYGHPEKSGEMFLAIANRLKMDNKTKKLVSRLIKDHDSKLSKKSDKIYEFLKVNCFDYTLLLFKLKRADNLAQNPEKASPVLEELDTTEQLYKEHMLRFDNLELNGSKLVELGYSGKRIKLILDDVKKLVVTNRLPNDERIIMEYISRRHRI
jgi:tRNA nucleotidyltransferase (CCA-adding enzyme)